MSQPAMAECQWLFQNSVEEDHLRQGLWKEQQKLAEERRRFEREKEEFQLMRHAEEQRMAREAHLFELKWKILEEELQQLAKDKQEIALEKENCRRIKKEYQYQVHTAPNLIHGEMFFSGVDSELGMKKRYKDLIKIFHPDNRDGDTLTLQVINKEYDEMKKQFYG